MMRRLMSLQRHHWLVLLAAMAVASVSLAWNSYQLIMISMANIGFLDMHGIDAVREGALVQLAVILGKGCIALVSYLAVRGIEVELVARWRHWGSGSNSDSDAD
jgi:hypothetical protein